MRCKLVVILLVVYSGSALPQTVATLQGKWSGTVKGQDGSDNPIVLVITESGGTWHYLPRGSKGNKNPCLGKDFPVVVNSQSQTDLVIAINGSKVLQGCLDQTATLKSSDGKSLAGSLADGRAIELTRQ